MDIYNCVDLYDDDEGSPPEQTAGNPDTLCDIDPTLSVRYDTYPGTGGCAFCSIVGADDVILNSVMGQSIGCRHCKSTALEYADGHNGFLGGSLNFLGGELQYSFIIGSSDSSIVGPTWDDDLLRSVGDLVVGGTRNVIDLTTVTTDSADRNSIIGGANNTIEATDGGGCQSCSMVGATSSSITNNDNNVHVRYASVIGAFDSEVVGILNDKAPDGSITTGYLAYTHFPYQKTHGYGPGYESLDNGVGALQTFELMFRAETPGTDSYKSMWPSHAAGFPHLVHPGLYTLDGKMTCSDTLEITNNDPVEIEVWTIAGVMNWKGGADTPLLRDADDSGADINLVTDFSIGTHSTWNARVHSEASGVFYMTVTPGSEADAMYCSANMRVMQSRQNTTTIP
jgi:hypothetical protein